MTCTICNKMPCECTEPERSMTILKNLAGYRDEAEDNLTMRNDLLKREIDKHDNCPCYRTKKKFNWRFWQWFRKGTS